MSLFAAIQYCQELKRELAVVLAEPCRILAPMRDNETDRSRAIDVSSYT